MKMVKNTIKAYGFLLGALVAAALLFAACENVLTQPGTQLENNYARVKINLVGEEDPLDPQTIARTTFPDLIYDVLYEYYFATKDDDGEYTVPVGGGTGQMQINADGEFLLSTGDYQVTVKAFAKAPGTGVKGAQGAEGSKAFSVVSGTVTSFTVSLKAVTGSAPGGISIYIDYPAGAVPTVNLQKATALTTVDGKTSVSYGVAEILTGSAGAYTKTSLAPGSYRLSIVITSGTKSAGTIEAIHIYPNLTTTYRKSYEYTDLSDPITIKEVALKIGLPNQGVVPGDITKVEYTGAFTVTNVRWTGAKEGSDDVPIDYSVFYPDFIYTVEISLAANTGYNFAGLTNQGSSLPATINAPNSATRKVTLTPDPVPDSGVDSRTVKLTYTFPLTKEVASIEIVTYPRLAYPHGEPLDLSGLGVRLYYTDGSNNGSIIPYADFPKWSITVRNSNDSANLPDKTPMITTDFNNKPFTVKCNGKTVKTDDVDTTKKLVITPKSLSASTIEVTVNSPFYNGSPQPCTVTSVKDVTNPAVPITLEEGADKDYTVMPGTGNRINAGTYPNEVTIIAVAGGNYTGSKPVNYIIKPQVISDTSASIDITVKTADPDANPAYTNISYTGSPLRPTVVVKDNDLPITVPDKTLPPAAYTVEYRNNTDVAPTSAVNPPTAIITFSSGNYIGTKTKTFDIAKGTITADLLNVTGVYDESVGVSSRNIYDGRAKKVTVALKAGTGLGTVTIKYNNQAGNDGTALGDLYPVNVGSYPVTMSAAAGTNFNATITDLTLGNLDIDKGTLKKEYFQDIPPVFYNGDQQEVATDEILLVAGHAAGSIGPVSNVRYGNPASQIKPRDAGTYDITVNVEQGTNFIKTGTDGLVVGQLIIRKKQPVYGDFKFNFNYDDTTKTMQVPFDGSAKQVIVTPGLSPGEIQMSGTGNITVYYTNTTNGTKTTTAPSQQGTYWITFDVAGGTNFEPGVNIGTAEKVSLVIGRATPVMEHFNVSGNSVTYDGNPKSVTVTVKSGIVGMGAISPIIKYVLSGGTTSTTTPTEVGLYSIMIDVEQGTNYTATPPSDPPGRPNSGLVVGWLDIAKKTPVEADFDIKGPVGSTATNNGWTITGDGATGQTVTVDLKSPKDGAGIIKVWYKKGTDDAEDSAPKAAGTYIVTFDVPGGTNFSAKTGLSAGTLTITAP